MNLLDENIPLEQRDLLRSRGVHCRVIGRDLAVSGISDDNIITLLHRLKAPTFFTRDGDFFERDKWHAGYGLVWLDAAPAESAMFIRRFVRHPRFRIQANRVGIVARVHHDGVQFWPSPRLPLRRVDWTEARGAGRR